MLLESVNVGERETIADGGRSMISGIAKYPVTGSIHIDVNGLRGDAVVNTKHHGGADQAIYAYAADDYDWWTQQTEREFFPGLFGENLTIRGMPSDMNVGDRLLVGEVVLEATAPRIPCRTLATRMRDPGFGLAFRNAARPGIYFRVLNSGKVAPGDTITFVANPTSNVSILELFRFNYALGHDAVALDRFLNAPLASRFREKVEQKLTAIESLDPE